MKKVFIVQGKKVTVKNPENLEPMCALHGITPQQIIECIAINQRDGMYDVGKGELTITKIGE